MPLRIKKIAERSWKRFATETITLHRRKSKTSGFLNAAPEIARETVEVKNCECKKIETTEEREKYGIKGDSEAIIIFLRSSLDGSVHGDDIVRWRGAKFIINGIDEQNAESVAYGADLVMLEVKSYGR